jgi:light-regulated signal transduction histidine kinase (bacteriophytochrome)
MTAMRASAEAAPDAGVLADARSFSSAILNILEDSMEEARHLNEARRAIMNILDDDVDEKLQLRNTQRATLNILDDFDSERKKVEYVNAELRREIAERQRAEGALRQANTAIEAANRELDAFSYSVAHDLRAPLRSIDGFSQALLEDCAADLPAEGVAYLGHVRESAQHMAQLIDDLLSLSRVSRVELHRAPIDLAAIARVVFARLQRDHPDRRVELVIPTKIGVVGDARLLELALENLLGNAWKFTRERTLAHIEFGETSQDSRTVYFVRDDGAGFDMNFVGKLFAVFQRLHTVREFEGTGVGLANVERVIHRHGGRIWADGAVGRGATFYFTLGEGA